MHKLKCMLTLHCSLRFYLRNFMLEMEYKYTNQEEITNTYVPNFEQQSILMMMTAIKRQLTLELSNRMCILNSSI